MAQYQIFNGPFPTTASQAWVTTGTSIKTMLQLKGVTALRYKIIEWGIDLDGAAASIVTCELLETGTVFGTVTASAAGDLVGLDAQGLATTSTTYFSVGTTATGYTCTGEGSITATRVFDARVLTCPATGAGAQYTKQYPLGREPYADAVSALRIRVKASVAVNCLCYVTVEV
jgi:hypothetical protein